MADRRCEANLLYVFYASLIVLVALKIEWFRSRERYRRWAEELKLIKRDMVLTFNSFQSLKQIWHFKSTSTRNLPGMAEYAAKKAHFYGELADQIHSSCASAVLVSLSLSFTFSGFNYHMGTRIRLSNLGGRKDGMTPGRNE